MMISRLNKIKCSRETLNPPPQGMKTKPELVSTEPGELQCLF